MNIDSLDTQVRLTLFKQFWACTEMYKPIFTSFSRGEPAPVEPYCTEVLVFEDLLSPYINARKDDKRFEYLKDAAVLDVYRADPMSVFRELYQGPSGKMLKKNNKADASEIGLRRTRLLQKFEKARQVLNRFAFELGLVDAQGTLGGLK